MLRVEHLTVRAGAFTLDRVDLTVNQGDYFVLLGPSGAGKTLLLETLAGFVSPTAGRISLDGIDITAAPPQRRGLGLVYQAQALFPHMTVAKNIAYGLPRRDRARTIEFARNVGAEHLLDRYPGTLSGGEAQRVALARALATRPKVLMLDEPLSALDVHARAELRSLLRRLNRDGQTVFHVTHDYEEALSLASRVAIIESGRVTHTGAPEEVFLQPKSEFVARFVGIRNFFRGDLRNVHGGMGEFHGAGVVFSVATDAAPGPGCLIVRSEDVTLSTHRPEGSARNAFEGVVKEVVRARLGVEVIVDAGAEFAALVTANSIETMQVAPGKKIWLSVKATTPAFVPE